MLRTIYDLGQGHIGQGQGHTGQGQNMHKFYFYQLLRTQAGLYLIQQQGNNQ